MHALRECQSPDPDTLLSRARCHLEPRSADALDLDARGTLALERSDAVIPHEATQT